MAPEITIAIPVYNTEQYLANCIESIINQSYKNLEIILVDDGSPDNCGKICDEYANNDSRIKVIHKENGGVSSARNCAIDIASGEYILFVDSDDFISDDSLRCIAETLNENKPDIVFLNGKKYFEKASSEPLDMGYDKNVFLYGTKNDILEHICNLDKFPGSFCTKAISTQFIRENNLRFNENQIAGEDIKLVIESILLARKYNYCACDYYYYRQNRENSASNMVNSQYFEDFLYIVIGEWLERCSTNSSYCEYVYKFLSYEYIVALSYLGGLERNQSKKHIKYMKDIDWLLDLRKDKKTVLIKSVYKILGLNITSKLLWLYLKLRDKK